MQVNNIILALISVYYYFIAFPYVVCVLNARSVLILIKVLPVQKEPDRKDKHGLIYSKSL